jgi:nitrate/TMAO reductase-like tetraheme cytochrome c subunit
MFKLSSVIIALLLSFSVFAAKSPHGANFSIKCDVCHNPEGWTVDVKSNSFDHSQTDFQLVGQHKTVNCRNCHLDLVFSNAKTNCLSCHKDVHQQTVGQDCARCHTTRSWIVSNITEIHRQSRFPLQGQHAQVDCYQCHKSASLLRFDPMGAECSDCHSNTYNATTKPSHIESKFPKDCFLCHTEQGWQPAKFDHNIHTTFPLAGGHVGVDCSRCHSKGYAGISTDCLSCHLANYNATKSPAHLAAKFSTDCKTCHTVKAWTPSTFNHNTSTNFALKGGHIGVDCIKCHTTGYTGTSAICVSCHLPDYNASKSPGHSAAKFSTDCKTCHTETAWKPSTFNHNTSTTFALKGGHIGVDCIKCHTTGYVGTSTICVSCHLSGYNATKSPAHSAAKFSTDCKTCHTETAWVPSTFNHSTSTTFPLTGGHFGLDCIKCHSKGYAGTSTVCVTCHQNDYNASTNPGHVAAKFSTDCKTCHTSTAWKPSTFNHNTSTTFPLTGGHLGVNCIDCHSKGYAGTSTVCVTCHQNDYNASTNPGHVAAKFSTDCKTCHTSTAWKPSTFNHNTGTTFPIVGAHIGVTCISCHAKGYVGISTDCVSCHLAKYNATTNPAHSAAKFPTTCLTCHSQTAWTPSTYNHDSQYFPINSGKHRGQWTLCSECHTNATNYAVFNCLLCHAHNSKATVDSQHSGRSGYAYNSTNCYSCHPRGVAD